MTDNTTSKDKDSHSAVKRFLLVTGVCLFAVAFAFSGSITATEKTGPDSYLIWGTGEDLPGDFWQDWDGDTNSFDGGGELTVTSAETKEVFTQRVPASSNITGIVIYATPTEFNSADDESLDIRIRDDNNQDLGAIQVRTRLSNPDEFRLLADTITNQGTPQQGTTYKYEFDNIDFGSNTLDMTVVNTSDGSVEASVSGVTFADSSASNVGSINVSVTNDDSDTAAIQVENITVINPDREPVYELSGKVTDDTNGTAIEGATVDITDINVATDTGVNGRYRQGGIENGTYTVSVSAPGYANETATVTVDGSNEVQDFQLEPQAQSLEVETRRHLEHGETADYTVTFTNLSGSVTDSSDVTAQANVTSLNTSIITINENRELVVATNDTSINARTKIKAEYQSGGQNYTATQNVTVANLTANNLKILPTGARVEAALEGGIDSNRDDRTVVVILIATMFGVAAAILATSFAGVAIMSLTMIAGWLGGWVGNGMVMVSILTGLFIGLNVAANIDYSTIRRGD